MTARSAKGLRGHILDRFDGTYFFRVYDADHNFKDYDLRHVDLLVVIDDEDAYLYDDESGSRLDHSPATLGIDNDS